MRKMCNLPFSSLSVICSPPLADLFFVCSLEVIEDGFSSWFHSISQQHLKGVVIALHFKCFIYLLFYYTLPLFCTSNSHVLSLNYFALI